mgnify:CR=1 FL=1
MSGGGDQLVCNSNNHNVMYDTRQLVIQHPKTCPVRGAASDKFKTFHHWQHAEEVFDTCSITLSTEDHATLSVLAQRPRP